MTAHRILALVSLAVWAGTALAQVPIPHEAGQCGGLRPFSDGWTQDSVRPGSTTSVRQTRRTGDVAPPPTGFVRGGATQTRIPTPRRFSVGDSGFCSQYSYSGWERTMNLYLGEGAADYLPLVSMAVDLWNSALMGFNREPVINIVETLSPRKFRLRQDFWKDSVTESNRNVKDGESVIYFKPGDDPDQGGSFARFRWNGHNRMVESDIYINTVHEEEYGPNLAETYMVLPTGESAGIHALVDSTYLTVVHEIGHALGLNHVPVSGNIMSYAYMPRMLELWRAPMSVLMLAMKGSTGISDYSQSPLSQDESEVFPYMIVTDQALIDLVSLYTVTVSLGEQDRMALMCVYDFKDWNHN